MDIVCRNCEHFRERGERIFCTIKDVTWGWDMYPNGCWAPSETNQIIKPSRMRNSEKEKVIREMYSKMPIKEIAKMIDMKAAAIYQAAFRMGIKKKCNR